MNDGLILTWGFRIGKRPFRWVVGNAKAERHIGFGFAILARWEWDLLKGSY